MLSGRKDRRELLETLRTNKNKLCHTTVQREEERLHQIQLTLYYKKKFVETNIIIIIYVYAILSTGQRLA